MVRPAVVLKRPFRPEVSNCATRTVCATTQSRQIHLIGRIDWPVLSGKGSVLTMTARITRFLDWHKCLQARRARGASLVDLLIGIGCLAILLVFLLPVRANIKLDAQVTDVRVNLDALQQLIIAHEREYGEYPESITRHWFDHQGLAAHPWDAVRPFEVEQATNTEAENAEWKLVAADATAAHSPYWYNPGTGQIRSRIRNLGSESKNVDLYNLVNDTTLTSMSDIQ